MSLTNAEQHTKNEGKGEWRIATRMHRCSNYFGSIATCARAISEGQRYFDTKEIVPDAGVQESFVVCAPCGNAPCFADFLKARLA